jgi:flagellar protein FlbD
VIKVTRLGGRPFYLNSDLIESLEAVPDTTLQLTTGKRVIVTESAEDVIQRIVEFRRDIFYKYPDERFIERTVERLDQKHQTLTER